MVESPGQQRVQHGNQCTAGVGELIVESRWRRLIGDAPDHPGFVQRLERGPRPGPCGAPVPRTTSWKRLLPSANSRTISSAQRSPTTSRAAAMGQHRPGRSASATRGMDGIRQPRRLCGAAAGLGSGGRTDGSRVVTTIAELSDRRSEYVTSVWELDPYGRSPPYDSPAAPTVTRRRRSPPTATCSSSRRGRAPGHRRHRPARLAVAVARRRRRGRRGVERARWRQCGAQCPRCRRHRGRRADASVGTGVDDDRRLRTLRKDTGVGALLHTGYPVRHWDHDLGPDQPHLFDVRPRDLTPQPGRGLHDAGFDVSADGRFLVTTWPVAGPGPVQRSTLLRVDVAPGSEPSSPTTPTPTWRTPQSRRTGRLWRSLGKPSRPRTVPHE